MDHSDTRRGHPTVCGGRHDPLPGPTEPGHSITYRESHDQPQHERTRTAHPHLFISGSDCPLGGCGRT
ncbi:hypothetical protein KGS77_29770 [Streptomyces sp. MST-110588]|nr:hypothetical protein KGS77_29770 [Streptomyces sp. MST-110588]